MDVRTASRGSRSFLKIFAALALAASTLVAIAATAGAAVGPNGQIAYAFSEFCCDYDIWVVNPDGTGATNLTNTPNAIELDPVWSPDGTMIAYTREGDVWTMNADGTAQTNVTNSAEIDFGPDWSPDGTQIAFTREVPGQVISTQFDIFTMNADGSGQTNVTNSDTDELEPSWSPLGTRIAVAGVRDGDWEIFTMNTDGTGESVLTVQSQEDRAPDWSPDGTMIVWMSAFDDPCCGDWEIWAMNADGSGATNLTQDPAGDIYPSWSPDGTEITFTSNRVSGFSFDVFAIAAPTTLPPAAPARARPLAPAASAPARQITSGGDAKNPDWGTQGGTPPTAFTLTVMRAGRGRGTVTSSPAGIRCGRDCTETYAAGSVVTLSAVARRGSRFGGWTGVCSGVGTCIVTMDAARNATATFNRVRG